MSYMASSTGFIEFLLNILVMFFMGIWCFV